MRTTFVLSSLDSIARLLQHQLHCKNTIKHNFAHTYFCVDGRPAIQMANSDIIKLAKSVNRWAASVAMARLFDSTPPTTSNIMNRTHSMLAIINFLRAARSMPSLRSLWQCSVCVCVRWKISCEMNKKAQLASNENAHQTFLRYVDVYYIDRMAGCIYWLVKSPLCVWVCVDHEWILLSDWIENWNFLHSLFHTNTQQTCAHVANGIV